MRIAACDTILTDTPTTAAHPARSPNPYRCFSGDYYRDPHWTDPARRTRDIDRLAEFEVLGWRIIRVSGDMLRYRPNTIVERTRAALRAAGYPA